MHNLIGFIGAHLLGMIIFGTVAYVTDMFDKADMTEPAPQIFTIIWPITLVLIAIVAVCAGVFYAGKFVVESYVKYIAKPLKTKLVASRWRKKNDAIYEEEQRRLGGRG